MEVNFFFIFVLLYFNTACADYETQKNNDMLKIIDILPGDSPKSEPVHLRIKRRFGGGGGGRGGGGFGGGRGASAGRSASAGSGKSGSGGRTSSGGFFFFGSGGGGGGGRGGSNGTNSSYGNEKSGEKVFIFMVVFLGAIFIALQCSEKEDDIEDSKPQKQKHDDEVSLQRQPLKRYPIVKSHSRNYSIPVPKYSALPLTLKTIPQPRTYSIPRNQRYNPVMPVLPAKKNSHPRIYSVTNNRTQKYSSIRSPSNKKIPLRDLNKWYEEMP